MIKRVKRIGLIVLVVMVIGLGCIFVFSRFTNKDDKGIKTIEYTVEIDTTVVVVFNYLGNSSNAADWSSYIDHITPINTDQFKDGEKGSIRRCFKNENEKGIRWDEEVLEVELNKKRVLSIYGMQGFTSAIHGLQTAQVYEAIETNKTRLTFTLYFADKNPGWFELFKMHLASFTIYNRFKENLEKVKVLVCE